MDNLINNTGSRSGLREFADKQGKPAGCLRLKKQSGRYKSYLYRIGFGKMHSLQNDAAGYEADRGTVR